MKKLLGWKDVLKYFLELDYFCMPRKPYPKTECTSLAILPVNKNLPVSYCPAPPLIVFIVMR